MAEPITAIGLMSGTSIDGVDAAVVRSDGCGFVEPIADLTLPYTPQLYRQLRGVIGGRGAVDAVSQALTRVHGEAVAAVLARAGLSAAQVGVIGFHGHTIMHAPAQRRTWQIGDGASLAALTGIDVVADFRSADVAAGGEGAPLAPLYHAAVAPRDRPLCVLNIGGVANLTWIGAAADAGDAAVFDHLLAFDTGPGNALVDDWMGVHFGRRYDENGAIAARGEVDEAVLRTMLDDAYFDRPPPKSLDREAFSVAPASRLSPDDGAATLTAFTAAAVARAQAHLPAPPLRWIVTGGGRRNATLLDMLRRRLAGPVDTAEQAGLAGDAMEAQAFAYLAVRSLRGLPLSGPSTTGAPRPLTGGRLFPAARSGRREPA